MSPPPDGPLSQWITELVGKAPAFDKVMGLAANDFFIPVAMALILLGLWFGTKSQARWRDSYQWWIMIASSGLGVACLIVYLFNTYIGSWPRPFEVYQSASLAVDSLHYRSHAPSFPCNSAAFEFAMAMGIWFRNRKFGAILFALAILMSFARFYVGAHYLSDIIVGALIGIASSYFFKFLFPRIEAVPTFALELARKLYFA